MIEILGTVNRLRLKKTITFLWPSLYQLLHVKGKEKNIIDEREKLFLRGPS